MLSCGQTHLLLKARWDFVLCKVALQGAELGFLNDQVFAVLLEYVHLDGLDVLISSDDLLHVLVQDGFGLSDHAHAICSVHNCLTIPDQHSLSISDQTLPTRVPAASSRSMTVFAGSDLFP